MKFLAFIKSPAGSVTVFVCLAAVGGWFIQRSNSQAKARAAQLTKVDDSAPSPLRQSILRPGQLLKMPSSRATPVASALSAPAAGSDDSESLRPRMGRDARIERPTPKPRVLPISLVAVVASDTAPALSKSYAPFGRLIPCETVITIESSKLDTPVLGLVTEDVWHNGELIIPAGAEVHGRASLDRARERIAVSGKWVIVWRDGSPLNGTELVLNGIALDRAKDDVSGEFGLRDGSAGLLGDLVKSDDWQEIKLFASTFLAGFAGGMQELRTQNTALGD